MTTEDAGAYEGMGLSLHRFSSAESVPRWYADALNINTGVCGVALYFGNRANAQVGSPAVLLLSEGLWR